MSFNSIQFFLFFAIFLSIFFFLSARAQRLFLLCASCVFYMAFIPEYILILFAMILVDFFAGICLANTVNKIYRRIVLGTSVLATCVILGVFKYFDFFEANVAAIASFFGVNYARTFLSFALPIGLSFHTFQSLSYVIEVYKNKQKAERNILKYALYVMFFPQLVAGPIERPQNLLHQFSERKLFDYGRVTSGLRLMAWGFFKKIVIADQLSLIVDEVFKTPTAFHGIPLIVASVFFAVQIYCDFSGYSDIAIGAAQVLGFRLMRNFNRPYFSNSISEFWRRWHISLSIWFRDYVYVPLGGGRKGMYRALFNLLLTFTISGLWHGASWTFVCWGAINGCYVGMERFLRRHVSPAIEKNALLYKVSGFCGSIATFVLITFAWIFFRANSMNDALFIITHLHRNLEEDIAKVFKMPSVLFSKTFMGYDLHVSSNMFLFNILMIILLFIAEYFMTNRPEPISSLSGRFLRWPVYFAVCYSIIIFWTAAQSQFIYFQF